MTQDMINEYQRKLDRLKRNKDNVPLEILATRYKKDYDQLKEELRDMTNMIIKEIVLSGLFIERQCSDKVFLEINRYIGECGILDEIRHAVYRKYDSNLVLKYANELSEIVQKVVRNFEEKDSQKFQ